MRVESPKIAAAALDGQLPVLSWKGGVEKEIKKKEKFGTLNYVAMWQGLRGDSLNIDTDQELTLTCTATNMRVVYTSDVKKFTESTEA